MVLVASLKPHVQGILMLPLVTQLQQQTERNAFGKVPNVEISFAQIIY